MEPPVAEMIDLRGCRITMKRRGDGPPVLFLHGATGAPVWLPFMEQLAGQFDLLVPEHPGFGGSDDPDWLVGVDDLAYFYLNLLDQLDLNSLHLVGTSMGGWIAAELAVRCSHRLASLTLVAPAGIRVPAHPPADIFQWDGAETIRHLVADPELRDRMLSMPQSDQQIATQRRNRATIEKLARKPLLHNPGLGHWLHRIDVPTQILWGREDQLVSVACADEWARLIPNASVTVFPDCGHLPHLERPEDYVRAIRDFAGAVDSEAVRPSP